VRRRHSRRRPATPPTRRDELRRPTRHHHELGRWGKLEDRCSGGQLARRCGWWDREPDPSNPGRSRPARATRRRIIESLEQLDNLGIIEFDKGVGRALHVVRLPEWLVDVGRQVLADDAPLPDLPPGPGYVPKTTRTGRRGSNKGAARAQQRAARAQQRGGTGVKTGRLGAPNHGNQGNPGDHGDPRRAAPAGGPGGPSSAPAPSDALERALRQHATNPAERGRVPDVATWLAEHDQDDDTILRAIEAQALPPAKFAEWASGTFEIPPFDDWQRHRSAQRRGEA